MKKVLIIDNDPSVSDKVRKIFEDEGFDVVSCKETSLAFECFDKHNPDAVIMDVVFSDADGFDFCREIRKKHDTPIIILSERSDTFDRIIGLELGADDYMKKPFEPKELLARFKAIMRRSEMCSDKNRSKSDLSSKTEIIEYPGLKIDKARYVVYANGDKVDMPPKELELLFFLASNPNRVFTRENLLGNVWGYDFFGESRTVDVHIKRIREKLDTLSEQYEWKIKTVWGVGYKFELSSA